MRPGAGQLPATQRTARAEMHQKMVLGGITDERLHIFLIGGTAAPRGLI